MRPKKVQIELFTNFLIATQKQYSCTELENVSSIELSHDAVNRFLNSSNFEAEMLWDEVSEYISKDDGYLIFDDITAFSSSASLEVCGLNFISPFFAKYLFTAST